MSFIGASLNCQGKKNENLLYRADFAAYIQEGSIALLLIRSSIPPLGHQTVFSRKLSQFERALSVRFEGMHMMSGLPEKNEKDCLNDVALRIRSRSATGKDWQILYALWKKKAQYIAKRYGLSNHQLDDDLVQICAKSVLEHIHEFDPSKGTFNTWVGRIMANKAKDILRRLGREKRDPNGVDELAHNDYKPPWAFGTDTKASKLWQAIEKLSELAQRPTKVTRKQLGEWFCEVFPKLKAEDQSRMLRATIGKLNEAAIDMFGIEVVKSVRKNRKHHNHSWNLFLLRYYLVLPPKKICKLGAPELRCTSESQVRKACTRIAASIKDAEETVHRAE